MALQLEGTIAARAKANQIRSGKEFGKGCQISDKPIEAIDTKREVASIANVSHDTVAKVKKIEAKAAPEVKQAKERMEKGRPKVGEPVANLPQVTEKTRAAGI